MLWAAVIVGWICGGSIGGYYIAGLTIPHYGDMDTRSMAIFFDGFFTAPIGAAVFAAVALFVRAIMETSDNERPTLAQYGMSGGIITALIVLVFWLGNVSTAIFDAPPPPPVYRTYTLPDLATPAYVGSYAYPGMAVLQNDPEGIVARTGDSYQTTVTYFNQKAGSSIDCTDNVACTQWTVSTTSSTPMTIQVRAVARAVTVEGDDTAAPTVPTTGPSIIYYRISQ